MQRKPYSSQVSIIDKKRWSAIFVYSIIISITTIAAVFASHELLHGKETWNAELCNNILFYSLIFAQILHVFNMSFERGVSFFRSEVFRNKFVWYATISCIALALLSYWIVPLRKVLEISIYGWEDWSIIIASAFASLLFIQLVKRMRWVI
jgi:Ca2+-transporting ATPase